MFCLVSLPSVTGYPKGKPEAAGSIQPIPLEINNKTIEIRKGMTINDVKKSLSEIITEEASSDTEERLQYDIQLVQDEAPVTVFFDFNRKKNLIGITIESFTKEQNPPVTALLKWLDANAGKPSARKKKSITWIFRGWKIEHRNGGSGEDSVYRIEFTLLK